MTLLQFLTTTYSHNAIFYNEKIVEINYTDKKREFKIGCQRIIDNLPINSQGIIKTPKSEYFLVSHSCKTAKRINEDEIKKYFE
ncbi:MAG: hypothetical protein ACKPE3_03945 [Sphaerospermopsis kisseleviana]